MAKRVSCLYRVSTKGQVEKDDIPMQRQVCHEFAEAHGWEIVNEVSEKGVSGFKVSAKDRDAIQELQKDAALGKFDVLLVFMFDRLGRKEDETPFIVEWFTKQNGIEVWSATEGQQRFDSHVDKLMNYIRYWQASGESIKTSIRTKTRLGQIVQEGRFRGGVAPYGYQLVKKGRLGKKNKELYDIEINETEAVVVRKIFELASNYGYGGRRIATELQKDGFLNRSGELFHFSSIQKILRNVMYTGVLRSGETFSEVFSALQIIPVDTFRRMHEIHEQRANEYEGQRALPRKVVGSALLSGNVYCGHCGGRIFATTAKRSHHAATGEQIVERVPIYKCYNRTQHKSLCSGPTTHSAEKVDRTVREFLHGLFTSVKQANDSDVIEQQYTSKLNEYSVKLKHAQANQAKAKRELSKYDSLMLSAIDGTGPFIAEDLNRRMQSVKATLVNVDEEIAEIKSSMDKHGALLEQLRVERERLRTWADMFSDAGPDMQKMIAASVIEYVNVYDQYTVKIKSSLTESQFHSGMLMEL